MTTYPLPTLAFQITPTGISAPSSADIYASLQATFQSIYGADSYIEPDSQDGQMLATFAQGIHDSNSAGIAVYNAFSPATAQGAGLSSNVKINGLARLVASNSTADVTIIGQAGTTITNGVVSDTENKWSLPATVTIPSGGSITVTATCQTLGAVTAAASTITQIATPTRGWQSVNNAAPATTGAPVETDAALRVRQSVSTSLPALSIVGGIFGALANLNGVTQLKLYENDTDTTDANGLPEHSISVVIQGGDANEIAETIAQKKTPGTATYGTTIELVIDPVGVPLTVRFYRPTVVPIDINITIDSKAGYVSTTGAQIVAQLKDYINALDIGSTDGFVFLSKLFSPANDTGAVANTYNVTALTMRRGADPFATTDIAIAFNELPEAGTVTLTVT